MNYLIFTKEFDPSVEALSGENLKQAIDKSLENECKEIVKELKTKADSGVEKRALFFNHQLNFIAMIALPALDSYNEDNYKDYIKIISKADMSKEIASSTDVKDIKEKLQSLEQEITILKQNQISPDVSSDITTYKEKLERLEKRLETVEGKKDD